MEEGKAEGRDPGKAKRPLAHPDGSDNESSGTRETPDDTNCDHREDNPIAFVLPI